MKWKNDSREFQDVDSSYSGKFSHVPNQPAVIPSPCGTLSRDQSLRPDTWDLLGTSGNAIGSPRAPIDSTPHKGMIHRTRYDQVQGDL